MNKQILRLAVPNIISNLSVPLLSSVDTAVVGHLDRVTYLGAIAIGTMIFNFVYWGFGFLRMGTTGLTAQAYGKNDKTEISLILSRSLLVAVVCGIGLFVFQSFIADLSFYLVNGSNEVENLAREYFDIRIFAAPATLSLYAFHGWFLGMQNARIPLYLTVGGNILNIIFNLTFIYVFGMQSAGVALGTVAAQYLTLLTAGVIFILKFKSDFELQNIRAIIKWESLKKFFSVNFDIFVRTLCLIFVFSFFTAKSAEFGDNVLAANTILLQLWTILAYGIDGFAFAAESLVGKFIGRNSRQELKQVIKKIFIWSFGIAFVVSVIYYVFDVQLMRLFTDNQLVIDIALTFYLWTAAAPLINTACYIWDGIFIGATATKAMRDTMLISTLLIFLPLYYFTNDMWGNTALWFSLTMFMIARGVMLSIYSPKHIFNFVNK